MKHISVANFFKVLKCPVCREPLELGNEGNGVLCPICRTKWEIEKGKLCVECGLSAADCRCMPELMKKAKIDALIKLCFYDSDSGSAADRFVLYMKDYRDVRVFEFAVLELASALKKYFAEAELDPGDLIFTYAPRSRQTLSDRGFDQAEILSRRMSKRFGAQFVKAIVRKRFSRRQKGLDSAQRIENAKRAFALKPGIELDQKAVVLIDDVVTTGASLFACAKLLRSAGAGKIICVSVALTDKA